MNQEGYSDNPYRINIARCRMVATAELLRAIRDMHHVDELFQWLSPAIVQHFSVQVVQFWRAQADYKGQRFMQLLAITSQDNSLPHRITLNKPVADLTGDILSRRTELALSLIGNVFSHYQATLFQRYGLYYCLGDYLNSNGQPPSSSSNLPVEGTLMPMEVVALLFFSQPPPSELQRSISYILKLAIQLAETGGLFLPPVDTGSKLSGYKLQPRQETLSALSQLVPQHKEDTGLMTTSTPLAGSIVIADPLARRLYKAIDGRKNIEKLCVITQLDLKEVSMALRTLLAERRIELFDANGQLVDGSSLLTDL